MCEPAQQSGTIVNDMAGFEHCHWMENKTGVQFTVPDKFIANI